MFCENTIVFQRGGQRKNDCTFKYGEENIEIVKEYSYLGIIFSNSCVFRKAAEHAKLKGMKALGSLWNLFTKGKINNWDTHRKLFDSIVTSIVLYSGQIWALHYEDILEKVQSKFIRRTFHLGFRTHTFAMRIWLLKVEGNSGQASR
jgi:hypothetical protein